MESHEIVKQLLAKVPAKQIASELGVSLSLVYKWAEPASMGSGTSNPLDRTEALMRLCKCQIPLQWLCSRFGGTFMPAKPEDGESMDVPAALGSLTRQVGVFMGLIGSLMVAKSGDELKIAELRQQWESSKTCIDMMLRAIEQAQLHCEKEVNGHRVNGSSHGALKRGRMIALINGSDHLGQPAS